MKNLLYIVFIIGFPFTIVAQWVKVNSNTTERLKDIIMVTESIGYCTGGGDIYNFPQGNGVILKTIDGGENWNTVFSQSDLAIHSIGIIENEIYGFAKLNGVDKLVSSNDQGITWEVYEPEYNIISLRTLNNNIYFHDANDNYSLKKMTTSGVTTLAQNIGLFGVNENEIIYINPEFDTIYKSDDGGDTFITLAGYPEDFSSDQSTDAVIKSFGNIIVARYTYPPGTEYSMDNGNNWIHASYDQENGSLNTIYSEIISPSLLLGSYYNQLRIQKNFQPWKNQVVLSDDIRKIYAYDENLCFVIGDNGMIYKTTNFGGLSVKKDTGPNKNIKIYPNPAEEKIILEYDDGLSIQSVQLLDVSGKIIRTYDANFREIDIQNITKGNYLLVIKTKNNKFTEKIVVK